ncbi:MAG: 5'-methylthioadenosine/adenosylhomocysteine nucleosidase [Trueperaceae bacterium]
MSQLERPLAILGAMPEEIAALLDLLEDRRDRNVSGIELHTGRLEGHRVVLALSGIGKVNAAAVAQLLIVEGPRALIFTGVAGAVDPRLRPGDIVIAADAVQHDVDVTALGYEPGQVPGEPFVWSCDTGLVKLATEAAAGLTAEANSGAGEGTILANDVTVMTGRVASGDQFVADPQLTRALHERFGATCVEMEGAAVAQVCTRAAVPFVIIRSISDSADHEAQLSFREFTLLAAARAKLLVRAMLRTLDSEN